MKAPWRVGDVVKVRAQVERTSLGEGAVLDLQTDAAGHAHAALVRFQRGPQVGVWYALGTLTRLRNLEGVSLDDDHASQVSGGEGAALRFPARLAVESSAGGAGAEGAQTPSFVRGVAHTGTPLPAFVEPRSLLARDIVLAGWLPDAARAKALAAIVELYDPQRTMPLGPALVWAEAKARDLGWWRDPALGWAQPPTFEQLRARYPGLVGHSRLERVFEELPPRADLAAQLAWIDAWLERGGYDPRDARPFPREACVRARDLIDYGLVARGETAPWVQACWDAQQAGRFSDLRGGLAWVQAQQLHDEGEDDEDDDDGDDW